MECTKLFDGTKFHIDLLPGAIAKHARPYPVPVIHLNAFKKELLHLVKIGVLSPQGVSEWASPTLLTPQQDSRVHWVSDLQEFKRVVKRGSIHYLSYEIFYGDVKDKNSLLH
jgi:hypothetical protein